MRCISPPNCYSLKDYSFPTQFISCQYVLTDDVLESIGWDPFFGGRTLKLSLDMISVMTAVSLNLGEGDDIVLSPTFDFF